MAHVDEAYKVLESPRQYYATVADSIPPPQAARAPTEPSSPQRNRTLSRTSTRLVPTQSHPSDTHISAHEPRAFPGVVHERERRRISTSGSDTTAPEMSASAHFESSLARMSVKEDDESQTGDSD